MPERTRRRVVVAALLLGAVSFVYRFNALGGSLGGFGNDQFIHLARADQTLGGGLPHRDYAEPGAPLTTWTSAAAGQLLGRSLATEAALTIGALAVGVALTVAMAARMTGRIWPAALVGLLQIAIAPRLYNYPKILVTAVGIWLCWRYADRPTLGRLAWVGLWLTTAFLFRHDYLFYVGPLAALTVVFALRGDRQAMLRHLAALAGVALLSVLPYLLMLEVTGGLREYVSQAVAFARADADRTSFEWPAFDLSLSEPAFAFRPPDPPPPTRVNVQWVPAASPGDRAAREKLYGLRNGELREGTTWSYSPADRSKTTLQALVRDPLVRDTHGIDRTLFVIREPASDTDWRATLRRVQIAPELRSQQNAVSWLYYTLALLPAAAALAWVRRARDLRHDPVRTHQPSPYIWPVIVMSALLSVGFLSRGTTSARLADVAVPAGILVAWLISNAPTWGLAARLAACTVLIVSIWSIGVAGAVPAGVERSRIASPPDAYSRFRAVWRTLDAPPLRSLAGDGETPLARAAAYVDRCVPRDSRVFVLGNLPELYYFAGRRFAGGHAWLIPGYANTPADQQLIIERLRRFDVPLVLVEPEPVFSEEYAPDFATLTAWVAARYDDAGALRVGDSSVMRVRVRRDAAWRRIDTATGLPCAGAPRS